MDKTRPNTKAHLDTDAPVFLEGKQYRLKRLADASRLLTFAYIFLICAPLLWIGGQGGGSLSTAAIGIYIFAIWSLAIFAGFLLAAPLRRLDRDQTTTDTTVSDADV